MIVIATKMILLTILLPLKLLETTDCNNDDHVLDIDEEVLVQIPQAHLLDLMGNANSKTCTVCLRDVFSIFSKRYLV